ncbi:MAG: hypothetical protein LBJ35_04440, partial [Spirochaetaceae bacterium]|nr:hypothetical protein [Spirochaetaceae bacterium]
MKKLKLGLAAFITALIFSSCGGEDAGILAASGAQEYDPGKDKVETDITVTFKNGWEDIAEGQIKDDEYTEGGPYKKLSPEKV